MNEGRLKKNNKEIMKKYYCNGIEKKIENLLENVFEKVNK